MIFRQRNLIRVVEAAYQLELEEQAWLDELVAVLGDTSDGKRGLMIYVYDASEPQNGAQIRRYSLRGLSESFARGTILHNAQSPPEDVRRVYHQGVRCGTVSEVLAPRGIVPMEHESFRLYYDLHSTEDAWGLSASNPDGRGVGIAAPLEEISSMSEGMRELWGLVGVHLATAYRLRRAQRSEEPAEESAILEPDGDIVHAEGVAFEAESREALGDAVRRIDHARSKRVRGKPDEALPMWRGLVEGRWSLVERYDSDGRRFMVALPNDPRFDKPTALTQRERQVVAYAAQGDSDERISYTLGLDEEHIEALLVSAMEKLGVWTRAELIELRRMLDPE